MTLSIKGFIRDNLGKESSSKIRKKGFLPAVIYGKGIEKNIHIYLDQHEFEKLLHKTGRNKIFEVELNNGSKFNVFVKDLQIHPLNRNIIHADLQSVNKDEEVVVSVPIEFVGVSKGTRVGGVFRKSLWSLKIKVKANQIPETIKIDVSDLDIGDTIVVYKVKDKIPYKIVNHDNTIIAGVYS
ncbi:MAG: 50S ribosomal protein L25 [Spirochaetia bacterium]|nr:50S ribosomal protein L25 [Spirochaetota bacterium]MDW8111803.1 50S ribosomal protein L25 [Spirochaetia bacterium]